MNNKEIFKEVVIGILGSLLSVLTKKRSVYSMLRLVKRSKTLHINGVSFNSILPQSRPIAERFYFTESTIFFASINDKPYFSLNDLTVFTSVELFNISFASFFISPYSPVFFKSLRFSFFKALF